MYRKNLSLVIVALLLNLSLYSTITATPLLDKKEKLVRKVEANVKKLGVGPDAKIKVKLKDGTKFNGYVYAINAESFIVMSDKSGNTHEVPFTKVKQVKGNNMSTGVKIAIGFGILAAIVVVIAIVSASKGGDF
jgi:hypothetical protein